MELERCTLLDSNGPKDRGHSVKKCWSSGVLDLWLHLGRKNPADMNLDRYTLTQIIDLFKYCSCANYLLNLAEILFSIY